MECAIFSYAFILIRSVLGSYLVDMAHDLFKNFVSAYYLKNEWMEFNIGIKDTSWNCLHQIVQMYGMNMALDSSKILFLLNIFRLNGRN